MTKSRAFSYIMRGVSSALLALLLAKLTYFNLLWISEPFDSTLHSLPLWSIKLVCCAALLLIYNSLVHFLSRYDRQQRNAFVSEDREVYFLSELRRIIKSPVFLLETLSAVLMIAVLSLFGAADEIVGVFFIESEPTAAVRLILPTAVYAPSFFVISLLCRYEIRRYFRRLAVTGNLEVLENRFKMGLRVFAIFVLYPLVFPYAPLLVYVAFSFISIFVSISALLTAVGVIVALVFIILLAVLVCYTRAISRRRRFIKRLSVIAAERGYTLSEIRNPIKSFFKHTEGESFVLRRGESVYTVRFLSTVRRGVRLYFTSDKHAYFLHRIGTKNHHISFHHNIDWGFSGEGIKIILVNPYPKHVFAIAQNGATRRLVSGDKIWDCIVYDDLSMLGAIDRDCLGRTN